MILHQVVQLRFQILPRDEIKIGVNYLIDGKKIEHMPSTLEEYKKVTVEYLTMPGFIIFIKDGNNHLGALQIMKNYHKMLKITFQNWKS